jgi:hypothetical protein
MESEVKIMKKIILFFLFSLILCLGCSQNIKISGHVKFDDGEPVSFGEVCFETAQNTFLGRLDPNGYYTVGNTKDGRGIPPDDYTVYLSGTSLVQTVPGKGNSDVVVMVEKQRVHPKHTHPNSDALKFTVKKDGKKTFDFTVERPPQKK